MSIVLGFIGAFIGSWVARQLKLLELFMVTVGREHFPVVWSIIGAALLVAVVHLLSGRRAVAVEARAGDRALSAG